MTPPYTMPPTYVGQMVNYFHQAGGGPLAAVVLGIGSYTLQLAVYEPEHNGNTFFDGVRHASDPNEQAKKNSGMGEWDYCPGALAAAKVEAWKELVEALSVNFDSLDEARKDAAEFVAKLTERVMALEAKVEELETALTQPAGHKKKAA